jgi:glycosyltransferase involved in cell wall biosynthesis
VEINSTNIGSTGTIMLQLAENACEKGYDICVSYPQSRENAIKHKSKDLTIGNRISRNLHLRIATLTGASGCLSRISTKLYLRKLNQTKPKLLHLHNLHNSYINLPTLFGYIKRNNIPVVWTLHDCWAFTGHCPHFDMIGCEKWKTGCYACPRHREYPKSYVDNSRYMYYLKKKWFTGVQNMTIVTPSQWLADLVKQSYLKDYPVQVINNGIDLSVFRPQESNFRKQYGIPADKKIILGVAFGWGERKGLDVFLELAKRLDGGYQIV